MKNFTTDKWKIPNNWEVVTIGELTSDWRGGASLTPEDFKDEGFPILHKGAIQRNGRILIDHKKKTFATETYARSNPKSIVNNCFLAATLRDLVPSGPSIGLIADLAKQKDSEYLLAQGAYGFKIDKDKVDAGYLVQLTNFEPFRIYLKRYVVGSTQIHIRTPIFQSLQIPLPPLPEQKRIAEVLDSADALREKRRLALNKLDSLLQSVFLEMFGDPVRNPKGFEKTELKNLIKEFRYGTSNKSTENGYYTLRIPNIINKEISFDDLKKVPVTAQELEKLRLKNDDILFVRTNGNPDNVGRCAVFNRTKIENAGFGESEFIFASYLIRARLDLKRIESIFLQYYLLTDEGRKLLLSKARTSAGQYNINTEGLGNLTILLPPLELQNKFASIVKKIETLKAEKQKSAEKLENLFQSLQQRAFKGELFSINATSLSPSIEKTQQPRLF